MVEVAFGKLLCPLGDSLVVFSSGAIGSCNRAGQVFCWVTVHLVEWLDGGRGGWWCGSQLVGVLVLVWFVGCVVGGLFVVGVPLSLGIGGWLVVGWMSGWVVVM